MSNIGGILTAFALGDATGIMPLITSLDKKSLGWIFIAGFVIRSVGTQWAGMAAADNQEVKFQLGLAKDGTKPANPISRQDDKENEIKPYNE
jgi:hypothetical protein